VREREQVGWRVPSPVWVAFREHARREHGDFKGSIGRAVESAMLEWIGDDDFTAVEERVDRLVQAAGRTPANLAKTKPDGRDHLSDGETTRVSCRVNPDLKGRFAEYVKSERHPSDDTLGVGLARALREYREGGRARRLEEKLDRITDDAEALLEEVAGEGDLSRVETRTIAICDQLKRPFSRDDLTDAIKDVAGGSDPTIEKYTERVLNRLDVVRHPKTTDLFVPKEDARDYGVDPGAPAVDRKPYDALSREEKVRGVQVELARLATSNGGKRQVDAATIQQDFFDGGEPSDGHVRGLMRRAADADGFRIADRRGKERLRADLSGVTDSELIDAVDAIRSDDAGAGASTRDPRRSDGQEPETGDRADRDGSDADDRDDTATVDAKMDELKRAKPVADGGQDGEGS